MPKNDKPTLRSLKYLLEMRNGQNKFEIIKGVRNIPMGLSISPKQFKEVFLQESNNKALKS